MLRNFLFMGFLSLILSACAAPSAFQIISLAVDGISYLATDKTIADHGLSAVTEKDCKMMRALKDQKVCQQDEAAEIEAQLKAIEPLSPEAPHAQAVP